MDRKSGACWAANPPERDNIRARLFQFPGRAHAHAVTVEQDPQHQPRVIRGLALGLSVGSVEPGQIQFHVHKLSDEPGQMAFGQPLIQRRRDQHHRSGLECFEAFVSPAVRVYRRIGWQLDTLHQGLIEQTIRARRTGIHTPILPATTIRTPLIRRRFKNSAHHYRPTHLVEFYNSAEVRSTPARRANAHVLLGLGAGAGLRAEEIARTRVRDISSDIAGLTVNVTGKHARSVPVRMEWVHSLQVGIDGALPDDWAFSGYRLPEYPARIIHQFGIDDPAEPTPTATRLRATWITSLLNARIPINVVLQLASLATATSLNPFVRAMDDAEPMDFLHLIRGCGELG